MEEVEISKIVKTLNSKGHVKTIGRQKQMSLNIKPPPEPKIERIYNLVNRIQSGDVKIPKFQRSFVWTEEQVIRLLESIYQGYPIGSLLFWLTEQPMKSERNIGGFDLPETPERYPRNYVLDGQQRLTTIYGVLNWPDKNKLHILNVYFDLEKEAFFQNTGNMNAKCVPMNILFKTSELMKFRTQLSEFKNSDMLQQNIDVLYETFREYLIPVVTIKEMTIEEVCPIFERINSTGTKLNIFDLMVAATWSDDFDLNDMIDDIRETAKLKDFDGIDHSVFLRFMSSIGGFGSKRDGVFKLRSLSPASLKDLGRKVARAVEKAIDFLSTDLLVPSDAFLPYENQLVVFAYYFSKVDKPLPAHLIKLRQWFWRTGFSERYRGASEGILEQDLQAVNDLIADTYEYMHIRVSLVENDIMKRQFWKNSAFCKTFVVLLANHEPKNLTNGIKIDTQTSLSSFNMKEFHHIFPKEFLKNIGVPKGKRNSLANICMLSAQQNKYVSDKAPSLYLATSYINLSNEGDSVFDSNLISPAPNAPWRNDDFESFIANRSADILSAINKKCDEG